MLLSYFIYSFIGVPQSVPTAGESLVLQQLSLHETVGVDHDLLQNSAQIFPNIFLLYKKPI